MVANADNISFSHLFHIVKFLDIYKSYLLPSTNIGLQQKFLNVFLRFYSKEGDDSFNVFLPWIYHQSKAIVSISKTEKLTPSNEKLVETLITKIQGFVERNILTRFCENSKVAVQQIIYDENVVQLFNSNVFNTSFKNLEYLLPIIDTLSIKLQPDVVENCILQFSRCVKKWEGELLLQNLLLLDKLKVRLLVVLELTTAILRRLTVLKYSPWLVRTSSVYSCILSIHKSCCSTLKSLMKITLRH